MSEPVGKAESEAVVAVVTACLEAWRKDGWRRSSLTEKGMRKVLAGHPWMQSLSHPWTQDAFAETVGGTLSEQVLPYRLGFLPKEATTLPGWEYRIGMLVWWAPENGAYVPAPLRRNQGPGVVTHAYAFPWGAWVVVALTDEVVSFVTDACAQHELPDHPLGGYYTLTGAAQETEEESGLNVHGMENRLLPLSQLVPDLHSPATQGVLLEMASAGRRRMREHLLDLLRKSQRGYSLETEIGDWTPGTDAGGPLSLGEMLVLHAYERGGWGTSGLAMPPRPQ